MTTLTVKDIERNLPTHGALVVLGSGVEVVFAKHFSVCSGCIFNNDGPGAETLGTNCARVQCGTSPNGGEYIPKMKYLELKLMGEIT